MGCNHCTAVNDMILSGVLHRIHMLNTSVTEIAVIISSYLLAVTKRSEELWRPVSGAECFDMRRRVLDSSGRTSYLRSSY